MKLRPLGGEGKSQAISPEPRIATPAGRKRRSGDKGARGLSLLLSFTPPTGKRGEAMRTASGTRGAADPCAATTLRHDGECRACLGKWHHCAGAGGGCLFPSWHVGTGCLCFRRAGRCAVRLRCRWRRCRRWWPGFAPESSATGPCFRLLPVGVHRVPSSMAGSLSLLAGTQAPRAVKDGRSAVKRRQSVQLCIELGVRRPLFWPSPLPPCGRRGGSLRTSAKAATTSSHSGSR